MKEKNIAILGATSHIAMGLIDNFMKHTNYNLFLFSRNPENIIDFLKLNHLNLKCHTNTFDNFEKCNYDLIINCIGIGRFNQIQHIFEITETFDNLVLSYLKKNKECLYISLSSGAVYGDFSSPLNFDSIFSLPVNKIESENYYSMAKINSEAKHRALNDLKIVDIRVFSYFSRFIDLKSTYLITEIINAVKNKTVLKTNSINIIRDYSNPEDLFSLISKCLEKKELNTVFDLYTLKPVSKLELFDFFKMKYNFRFEFVDNIEIRNNTGGKNSYYSTNFKANEIGFTPQLSSIEGIEKELSYILNK